MYDVLALRVRVFVVEQECAYQELDGDDLADGVRHLIGRDEQKQMLAYARILPPAAAEAAAVVEASEVAGAHEGPARIGRVIITEAARGHQLGRRLMQRALEVCAEQWPDAPVLVGAQAHLADFYASLGFVAIGEPYDEDGIPHLDMQRPAAPTAPGTHS